MQPLRIILILACLVLGYSARAQEELTYDAVDKQSFALYQKTAWKELLAYGKDAVAAKQDFNLLRLRMGYAAFMLNNFSEALTQYEAVLKKDSYNNIAHYYIYLCRKFLNQRELADAEMKFLSKEQLAAEKLKPVAFTDLGIELSYKLTNINARMNPFYAKFAVGNRFGPNLHMEQAMATYQQTIREPKLLTVVNNNNINISQFEYFNRITLNFGRNWQLKVADHFTHTPFNNLVYNDNLILGGIKYSGHYFDLQADAVFGKMVDSSLQQYNLQLGLYPLGNLNLYSFSTGSLRQQGQQSAFNFKEVLGVKLLKILWLEGNATFGNFRNLVEQDAVYIYNAIDPNQFKGGFTAYITLSKNTVAQLGYSFEQRQLYLTPVYFNQHSITGGLTWKF